MPVIDIGRTTGLPVLLDLTTGSITLGAGTVCDSAGARTLSQLRPLLRDPAAAGPELLYRLYRGVRRRQDEQLLAAAGLRHDLTITMPGRLGAEYVKTSGHYHPRGSEQISFPELYEVAYGRAAFLLQRVDDAQAREPRVLEVWLQVCEAGERILIPPDCGHVSINIGDVPLVVADLISRRSGHLYGSFQERHGAAYYVLAEPHAEHGLVLEPNPAYGPLPEAHVGCGPRSTPVLADDLPAYAQVRCDPGRFAFLEALTPNSRDLVDLWRGGSSPLGRARHS